MPEETNQNISIYIDIYITKTDVKERLPMFSFRGLMGSGLAFKSLVRFASISVGGMRARCGSLESIAVRGMRAWCGFFESVAVGGMRARGGSSACGYRVLPTPFTEEAVLPPLSEINCPFKYGFIPGFSGMFH